MVLWVALLLQGCIHSYPEGSGVDPEAITLRLRIDTGMVWEDMAHSVTDIDRGKDAPDTKSARTPHLRITTRIGEEHGSVAVSTTVFSPDEIPEGYLTFTVPEHFSQKNYSVALWADFVDPDTHSPMGYDLEDLTQIRPLFSRGTESESYDARYITTRINLSHITPSAHNDTTVTLPLQSPSARFELIPEDYKDFLDHFAESLSRGEKYTVAVEYISDIPERFNLLAEAPVSKSGSVAFSTPLDIITIPGYTPVIASDRIFIDSGGEDITLRVLLLDSSKKLITSISDITIPLRRGKTTKVSGRLLLSTLSSGLSIDNNWNGEITVSID